MMPLSQSLITRMQHQHQALSELVDGLSEQQLRQRTDSGKWSAFENIAHLAAYQPMFLTRLERVAAEDSPSFERYVAENDPRFPQFLDRSLEMLLRMIAAGAQSVAAHLLSLGEGDLLRVGLHPRYGRLSVPQWTQFYLLHEAHHLYTIFMLTQDLRAAHR